MKKYRKLFIVLTGLSIALIALFSMWSISESRVSYEEPQEALLAEDEDLVLIPTYKTQDEALFFFIENENNLGAAMVFKNLLGWKADFRTWSPFNEITTEEKVGGYQIHGERVIFGLMKDGDDQAMMINNIPAATIALEISLPNKADNDELNGLYLWYYETDNLETITSLSLVNRSTNKEIDVSPFPN